MKPRLRHRVSLVVLLSLMVATLTAGLVRAGTFDENGNMYTGTIPVYDVSGNPLGEANIYQPVDADTPGNVTNDYTVAYVDPASDLGKALLASGYELTGSGVAMESTGTPTGTSWNTTTGEVSCKAEIDPNCQGADSGMDGSIQVWIPQEAIDTINPPPAPPPPTCPAGYQIGGGGAFCEKIPEPTKTCSDGSVIPQSQTCPAPPPEYKTCWDGSKVLSTSSCPPQAPPTSTTQTCSDGSVIPLSSTCPVPTTTKTCADGSVIPSTSTCPTVTTSTPPETSTPSCPSDYSYNGSSCYYDPPCDPNPDTRSMSVTWTLTTLPNTVGVTRGTMTSNGTTSNRRATASWGEVKDFQSVGGFWVVEFTPPAGVVGNATITSTATIRKSDGCGDYYGPSTFTRSTDLLVYAFQRPKAPEESADDEEDMTVANLPLADYLTVCLGDLEQSYCGIDARLAETYLPELMARESWYSATLGEDRWRRLVNRIDRALSQGGQQPSGLYVP